MRFSRRRTTNPVLPALLVTTVVMAALVAFSPGAQFSALRGVLGWDQDRLGEAPDVPRGQGSFEFSRTQRGGEPVGYNPCDPVRLVVNPEGAPAGYEVLLDTAIRRTSAATGLQLELVGTTDDRDFERHLGGPSQTPPVLVAWASEQEFPELADDVAGAAGSTAVKVAPGRLGYVTGVVVLDREAFATYATNPMGQRYAQAVLDHEFGHLVGLSHVQDRGELMHGENVGVTSYGPGDREGLARLGSIDCW